MFPTLFILCVGIVESKFCGFTESINKPTKVEPPHLGMWIKIDSLLSIEILDLSGKSVMISRTKRISKSQFEETFDISKFTPGMYIFKITIGDEVYTKELLKIK